MSPAGLGAPTGGAISVLMRHHHLAGYGIDKLLAQPVASFSIECLNDIRSAAEIAG
jgi:hypothetical protein